MLTVPTVNGLQRLKADNGYKQTGFMVIKCPQCSPIRSDGV